MSSDKRHSDPGRTGSGDGFGSAGEARRSEPLLPSQEMALLIDAVRRAMKQGQSDWLEAVRAVVREEIERMLRRPLVPLSWLVHQSGASERTVIRRLEAWQVPRRKINGDLWRGPGDGPVVYSLDEWEAARRLHTQVVKKRVRHETRSDP